MKPGCESVMQDLAVSGMETKPEGYVALPRCQEVSIK